MNEQQVADAISKSGEALVEQIESMLEDFRHQQTISMKEAVASGFEEGLRRILADKDTVDRFWKGGFERFAEHGTDGASKWVGKRLLTASLLFVLGLSITWLAKLGAFK